MQLANLTAPVATVCGPEPEIAVVVKPTLATVSEGEPPHAATNGATTASTKIREPAARHLSTVCFFDTTRCRVGVVRHAALVDIAV